MVTTQQDRLQAAEITKLRSDVYELEKALDLTIRTLNAVIDRLQAGENEQGGTIDKVIKDQLLDEPVISIFRDTYGHVILNLNPGSPNAVQNLVISNAPTGGAVTISAVPQAGGDSDIDIDFQPGGNGVVSVRGTPVQLT